ncbi:MAG: carboxypeptidase-like regulatory domain-containing protein [Smithella sp.]
MTFLMIAGCGGSTSSTPAVTTTYTISGTVTGASTSVTINLTGAATTSTTTNATTGAYSLTGMADGTYTVTPSLSGYTFSPVSAIVTVNGGDATVTTFVATATSASTYKISGTVTASGAVKSGVTMTLTLGSTEMGTYSTDAGGNYSFSGLLAGSYTVTPTLTGYNFQTDSPGVSSSFGVTVSSANVTDANFIATTIYSQSDLTGTWNIQMLYTHQNNGSGSSGWTHATGTIDSSGNFTAITNCASSSGSISSCPAVNTLTWTIDPTTGVITESGSSGNNTAHWTMAANKNFIVGTETDGGYTYQIAIAMKAGTSYRSSDLDSTSFVLHSLIVGADNYWEHASGTISPAGVITMTSETDISTGAIVTTLTGLSSPGTVSVSSSGVVTFGNDTNFYGFLSADEKTIIGTESINVGVDFKLVVLQITTGQADTAGFIPDEVANIHFLSVWPASDPLVPYWAHWSATVTGGNGMMVPNNDYVSSNSSSAENLIFSIISASGTVTSATLPTYNGQMSYDGNFIVGTTTVGDESYGLVVSTVR